jgi:glycosyltransferase involved in cell wall biosynthesis
MRILIVHNTLNDSKSCSGVLRHYAWMAEEWNKAGHRTDFLVATAGFPQLTKMAPSARLISSDSIFNATRHIEQTWRYFPAYGLRMLTAHTVALPETYDVIYASTQLIVEVYVAMIIARRQGAAFVAKVHHVLAAQQRRGGMFDHLFIWSERRTTEWLNHKADLIITGTRLVGEDLDRLELDLGLTPRKKIAIGYGVDLEHSRPAKLAEKEFDVVFLGRLHEHKGAFDLPKFWRAVKTQNSKARLLVIGEGAHRPRTQQMFADAGLERSVVFTGGIDEAQKNELLAKARIGLSLSYEEGWGLSINEFLAHALPVVAYDLPIFHFVFPNQLNLVPLGDVLSAAAAVNLLLAEENSQIEQGSRGRQFVQRYDFRNVAREEMAVLEEVSRNERRAAAVSTAN